MTGSDRKCLKVNKRKHGRCQAGNGKINQEGMKGEGT